MAAHSGAADEVPPRVFQPERAALKTVIAPVNSSESALTSGSWRQAVSSAPAPVSSRQNPVPWNVSAAATAPELLVEAAPPGTCGADCHAGIGQDSEMPPPPAPHTAPSFQTCSFAGWVASLIVVPPVATTYGWLEGSSTDSTGSTGVLVRKALQSLLPWSPLAEKMVCPWAAACWKMRFSACWMPGEPCCTACSHSPQLVVTILSTSSLTICAYSSIEPNVLFGAS